MDKAISVAGSRDQTLAFHDVDQLNHAVSGSNLELMQLKPGRLEATVNHLLLGDLYVDYGAANLPLRVRGGLDPQRFALGMFPSGTRATWNGNHIDPSRLLFFMPGRELSGFTSETYAWTSLVLPPVWVESISASLRQPGSLRLRTDCRLIHPGPVQLAELWKSVAAIVSSDPSLGNTTDSAVWLIADFRNALGGAMSAVEQPGRDLPFLAIAHFSLARRAECYMRERITEPLCIDEVCIALRVSRRYLEYAFTDAFGSSPSRYLRLLRMHEVRRRLKAPGEQTTVTREALGLGFNHLSLFSVQYKKIFGESPSTTLTAAVRNASVGASLRT
jgi:AraC family ethanolamine operon transcriptional activator